MAMSQAKRRETRQVYEAQAKARKDERLGMKKLKVGNKKLKKR